MQTLAIQDTFEPYYEGQPGSRDRVPVKRPRMGTSPKPGDAARPNDDGVSKPADLAAAQATEH